MNWLMVDATETIDSTGENLFKEMEEVVTQTKRALHKAMKVSSPKTGGEG
jgi:hypothetical protein